MHAGSMPQLPVGRRSGADDGAGGGAADDGREETRDPESRQNHSTRYRFRMHARVRMRTRNAHPCPRVSSFHRAGAV